MIHLETLKKSPYFEIISLKNEEILFDEGDTNPYIYIVYDGEIQVQKRTSLQNGEYKNLGQLGVGNIIGEASLIHTDPKEARIKAVRDTILLRIDAQKNFKNFTKENPEMAYEVLSSIIHLSNIRLLRANNEITANYEVSKAISQIHHIDTKAIYGLLENFQKILGIEQILYFEKNIVMPEYYKLKYHSSCDQKLQNTILKFNNDSLDIDYIKSENINVYRFHRHTALFLGERNHGFIVIGRLNKDFNENEEKILFNLAISLVGVLHQKEMLDEQRNKLSAREMNISF